MVIDGAIPTPHTVLLAHGFADYCYCAARDRHMVRCGADLASRSRAGSVIVTEAPHTRWPRSVVAGRSSRARRFSTATSNLDIGQRMTNAANGPLPDPLISAPPLILTVAVMCWSCRRRRRQRPYKVLSA